MGTFKIAGKTMRTGKQKSLAVYARKAYGSDTFDYPFFEDRDYDGYSAILLRYTNSDFKSTRLRDAALQELAKAGVPADNIVSSRPRVNAATQYLSEDEELAGICAADGEGDPKLSERFNKIRRSLCTLENPLWFSHRRASLAKKQHEGRIHDLRPAKLVVHSVHTPNLAYQNLILEVDLILLYFV